MKDNNIYNLRVLYIEDEADTMDPMLRFLRRRFASVTIASDGEEGFRKFNEATPDLIITDLLMPGCSGIDLIRKIRGTGYTKPIVITSALQDVESIIKTVDLGISKYIIKPINMTELDADLNRIGAEIMVKSDEGFDITIAQKKEYEAAIRHYISNVLKQHSGKGPKEVKVFIGTGWIEINCLSVRTTFEETLYQSGKNIAITEQVRRLFYQILKTEIEIGVSNLINKQATLSEIVIHADLDNDMIRLTIG